MNILRKNVFQCFYHSLHPKKKYEYIITTPIYYVNSTPHIGHVYTSLLADASHRFHCMLDKHSTFFTTGTDEHGTKVQQAAVALGSDTLQEFCDKISSKYRSMNECYDISNSLFVRTTDVEHMNTVKTFWKVLTSKGHISKGKYQGWYCDADEAFLPDHLIDTITDHEGSKIKVSAESGRPVNWVEEDNFIFHLPKFKSDLKYWLNLERSIQPEKFRLQVLRWIDEGLADEDVSISRPRSRVHWAISVPDDELHTIYVWLDALVNYLTALGYPNLQDWPPHVQVIGKDILKFHAIYWPAFLIAANLEPPRTLMVHSHWTVDGEKMSKSRGNIVCPFEALQKYGVDGVRYFLLREGTPHSDGNFSDTKLVRTINAELADTLGNLLSRCCGKTINPLQIFPPFIEEDFHRHCINTAEELINLVNSLPDEVSTHYMEFNFYKGISQIMAVLREANRFFEHKRPWELRKSKNPEEIHHLNAVLCLIMETLRICGLLLNPIVPALSSRLLNKLNIPREQRLWSNTRPIWNEEVSPSSVEINKDNVVLFKRIQQ